MISIFNHSIHKLNSFLVSWLGTEKQSPYITKSDFLSSMPRLPYSAASVWMCDSVNLQALFLKIDESTYTE